MPPSEQMAHIRPEKKGRGGKTVTVIMNLELTDKDRKALAKKLKQVCGVGGAIKDDAIEIQGDNRQKVADQLIKMGYNVKFVGG